MLPIIWQNSFFILYSYPLFMGLGWGVAYHVTAAEFVRAKRQDFHIVFFLCFLAAWLGAKLLFLLTSAGDNWVDYSRSSNFWLGGGFVFYGGLLMVMSSLYLYTRYRKERITDLFNLLLPGLVAGHGIGRLGCFLAGCCYGEPVEWHPLHLDHFPVPLFEALGIGAIYLGVKNKVNRVTVYLLGYAVVRFFLEYLRADQIRGQFILTTSQWVSLLVIAGLIILKPIKHKIKI